MSQPGPTESDPGESGQADAEVLALRAEPIPLIVRAPNTVPVSALFAVALLACCVLAGVWVFVRRRGRVTPPSQADPLAEVSAIMHTARATRQTKRRAKDDNEGTVPHETGARLSRSMNCRSDPDFAI